MSFLKAEWRKLALANYVVDRDLLEPYVPFGTELDTWEGTCYASLVGFMFLNTKVMGLKIPWHVNFEEVNLRFYVKRKEGDVWKRGVVFIKEIVPKPAISWVANTIYREHYQTCKMSHEWAMLNKKLQVEYRWQMGGKWNLFSVETEPQTTEILPGSEAEFITEHYWGYAKVGENSTNEYEVTHPRWQQYNVLDALIEVDFEANYGKPFAFLSQKGPKSIMLAEGSPITVEGKRRL